MKRTLSITLDDDAKTIAIEGEYEFSLMELFGIAEHLHLKTRLGDIRAMENAEKQAVEKPKRTAKRTTPNKRRKAQ